ncbi:MAG TPA: hypothetical protein VHE30_24010 [Polyangiaceae bacterium]|nr:hypothetical protein [Polyangiaceae bacterium]
MAGYSSTPLPKKLGIKEGSRVLLLGAPKDFERTLGALPALASLARKAPRGGPFDVVIRFFTSEAELGREFGHAKAHLATDGGLWIAWPKKASGVPTDVTENTVRACALASGLVDNKVCAIDDVWSGLRVVYRVADRPKEGAKRAAKKATRDAKPGTRGVTPRR